MLVEQTPPSFSTQAPEVVVDHDVEAVGGQRVDNVQEARIHAVIGQKLVADAVRRAHAASHWALQATRPVTLQQLQRSLSKACSSRQQMSRQQMSLDG